MWSLLETAEPVAIGDRMDTGGVWAGLPGRVTAHGTSLTQAGFRFAGAEAGDPLGTGRALFDPDLAFLSSLRFATALLPAGVAGAGPVVAATPIRPGREWSGSLTADFASARRRARRTCRHRSRGSTAGPSGTVVAGGPLGDRTGLVLAAGVRDADRFERADPAERSSRVRLGDGPARVRAFRRPGGPPARGRPADGPARSAAAPPPSARASPRTRAPRWSRANGWAAAATARPPPCAWPTSAARSTAPEATLSGTVERLRRRAGAPTPAARPRRVGRRLSAEAQLERPAALFGARRAGCRRARPSRARCRRRRRSPGVWRTPERLDGVGGARVGDVGRAATPAAVDVHRRRRVDRRPHGPGPAAERPGRAPGWSGWAPRADLGAADVSWLDGDAAHPRAMASGLRLGAGRRLRAVPSPAAACRRSLSAMRRRRRRTSTAGTTGTPTASFALPERGALVARYGPGAPVAELDDAPARAAHLGGAPGRRAAQRRLDRALRRPVPARARPAGDGQRRA